MGKKEKAAPAPVVPGAKTYVCNRYPEYAIGGSIRFHKAQFTTADPALQAKIEKNEWYKVYIWPREGKPVEPEKPAQKEEEAPNPTGAVQTKIDEPEGDESEAADAAPRGKL
jgi:hypothetical protein